MKTAFEKMRDNRPKLLRAMEHLKNPVRFVVKPVNSQILAQEYRRTYEELMGGCP